MWLFGLSEVVSGTLIYVVKNLGGGGEMSQLTVP